MPAYLGLHHGPSFEEMDLVAATADTSLIRVFAKELEMRLRNSEATSRLVRERARGRLRALRRLQRIVGEEETEGSATPGVRRHG